MNKLLKILILFTALALLGILFWQLPSNQNAESDAKVAATIFPIYDIAKNITGDILEIELILPAGASPHTYEPTPSNIRSLSNVEAVYSVGHGFDDWANLISESIGAEQIIVDSNIDLLKTQELFGEDLEEHEIDFGNIDPHYWLSIVNAKHIAQTITTDLSKRYPEYATNFADNLENYTHELDNADSEIRNLLSEIDNPSIITFHNAWYYFAEAYDLFIVGSFEPNAGQEPTPKYLTQLINIVKLSNVSTIYSEPQLDTTNLLSFLSDNNLRTAVLDPIGGVEGRQSYIELMLYNAEIIAQNQ